MITMWIFTEGDQQRGLGHLSRCSSYATAWEKLGGKVQWVIDGDSIARQFIDNKPVIWKRWQYENTTESFSLDIALIDSYCTSLPQLRKISSSFRITIYLDDTFRLPYPNGVVIHPQSNSTPFIKSSSYWLMGSYWQPIRPEFLTTKNKISNSIINNILIMIGGTDIINITPRIVDILREAYPSAQLHIIANSHSEHYYNCTYYSHISANKMAELMRQCDISICAAGQTIFELIACLLPSIIIKTANNQSLQLDNISHYNLFEVVDDWNHKNITNKIYSRLSNINDHDVRCGYIERMKKYNLCDGATQLSKLIFDYYRMSTILTYNELTLVPFTQLSTADKIKVLSIRNKISVRKEMINAKRISKSSHFKFIKSQINKPFDINYAIFYEGIIFGSTALREINWIKKEAWLDIYRHPSDKWSGFGQHILSAAKHIAFNIAKFEKLKLNVKITNHRALSLYYKNNFTEDSIKDGIIEMSILRKEIENDT
ncbi:GNAT family N-acetyltransferase [Aeromonas sp. 82P]|uniref:GNAT family N-acetyltransferase n=1 Tax=Aeromonas TaxID=642 RepID=UPI002246FC90|nr:GNAT family N-acetyltransferase [Aeromonas veronii]MCX0434592.1 bifunctional UDP-2,4-diacetamido-2,4,6-trideoxy-beta-L-altropyranose hydrolase/GNAT family N-acetyltransferase [Aeromonas veronii]